MKNLMVSICCSTFNQEKYIADAIEGFLKQVTNFDFEILIHDDASTDNTQKIIKEYEKAYPELIKPIYQTENQYSKGKSITSSNIFRAKGKYIALCEGDDYWTDPNKLQLQVDYMENHPDCTFCYTNALVKDLATNEEYSFLGNANSQNFDLKDSIEMLFVPTASFMFPRECALELPESFHKFCPYGDLKLRLYLTGMGYARYINEPTCVYRKNVPNSIMTKWKKSTKKQNYDRSIQAINMLDDIDNFFEHIYLDDLKKWKNIHYESILHNADSFDVLKNEGCKNMFFKMNILNKIKVIVKILLSKFIKD